MQGIVIQGPTNYCTQVAPLYKDIPNVVWSTWDDEPQENIKFIEQYVPVLLNKKPSFSGYLNVNFQIYSSYAGIDYLKNLGVNEVLKTRGDIIITNLNKLLSSLHGKDMAFLAIAKEGARKDLYYELVYNHFSHDYPVDLVMYGNIDHMSDAFSFMVNDYEIIPPEAIISYNYLINRNIKFKLNYDHFVNNGIYFYLRDCIKNNVELQWIKHNYTNLVDSHNNDCYEF